MARCHMEENEHSYSSVAYHMKTWRSIYNYAVSRGIHHYTVELAEQYMLEKYSLAIGETPQGGKEHIIYIRNRVRALRALTDFMLHGFIPKEQHGRENVEWPDEYKEACLSYLENYKSLGYKASTVRQHELALWRFVKFLQSRNVLLHELNAQQLYEYFKSVTHFSRSLLSGVRFVLVHSLDYFYKNGYIPSKISEFVPRVRYYAKAKLIKIWTEDEVIGILSSIDTANSTGKRDYAILIIATEYGLRESDIVSLTMDNFRWKNGTISLIQKKTGEPLVLPLSEKVGKAVIDYWMNGRPKTIVNEIFVSHVLPYKGLSKGSLYNIFNKYLPNSGYTPKASEKHGLNSLRHRIASRLLEKKTPINVISNILGHVDSRVTSQYLHIDIEALRECSLEVPDYD